MYMYMHTCTNTHTYMYYPSKERVRQVGIGITNENVPSSAVKSNQTYLLTKHIFISMTRGSSGSPTYFCSMSDTQAGLFNAYIVPSDEDQKLGRQARRPDTYSTRDTWPLPSLGIRYCKICKTKNTLWKSESEIQYYK